MKTKVLKAIDLHTVRRWLPKRQADTHKGDFGKLLLLCGAVSYTGAPALAAMAAVRTGAGLVFTGVPERVYPIVASKLTEPMVFPLPAKDGTLSREAIPEILTRLGRCDACLIGCGLGQSEDTYQVVRAVLEHAKCPVVVDADGINVLAGHIDVLRGAACPVILTPHDGEFRRLTGMDPAEDRLKAVKQLQRMTGATVLLKGHRTLICGEKECYVNLCGNPGMATGGSGDVLAGIIVSLLGQGLSPLRAATAGAYLHGAAGDLYAQRFGEYGLLPSDLLKVLPRLLY